MKSLLTKATSPSRWSAGLPGQGDPAGIHEEAPQNQPLKPCPAAATSCASLHLSQPRARSQPSSAARQRHAGSGSLRSPLARLAGCWGHLPPHPPSKYCRAGSAGRGCERDAPHLCRQASRRRGGGGAAAAAGTPAAPRRPLPLSGSAGGWLRAAAGGRGFPCPRCPLSCLPASRSSGHALAPRPNFLNLPDTWTSISLTRGGRVSRPARPAPFPAGHPRARPATSSAGQLVTAPLPPRGADPRVTLAGAVGPPAWQRGEGLGRLQALY